MSFIFVIIGFWDVRLKVTYVWNVCHCIPKVLNKMVKYFYSVTINFWGIDLLENLSKLGVHQIVWLARVNLYIYFNIQISHIKMTTYFLNLWFTIYEHYLLQHNNIKKKIKSIKYETSQSVKFGESNTWFIIIRYSSLITSIIFIINCD